MDYMQGIGQLSDDVWRWVMGINLDGPMFTMRRAVPKMVEQGGGAIVKHRLGRWAPQRCRWRRMHGCQARAGRADKEHRVDVRHQGRAPTPSPGGTRTNIVESMARERLDPAGSARVGTFTALVPACLSNPYDILSLDGKLYITDGNRRRHSHHGSGCAEANCISRLADVSLGGRNTGGNFRVVERLFAQIQRVAQITRSPSCPSWSRLHKRAWSSAHSSPTELSRRTTIDTSESHRLG